MVWAAPGQLARASPTEAMAHLRADLLPPPSAGPPVLPFTAHAGAAVQLAYGFWDPSLRQGAAESGSRGAATTTTASGDAANMAAVAALQDAVDKKAAKAVIGVLLEQVCGVGLEQVWSSCVCVELGQESKDGDAIMGPSMVPLPLPGGIMPM